MTYEEMCQFETLYMAYLTARKGKRGKAGTAQYEANALACTEKLSRLLLTKTYRPSKFEIQEITDAVSDAVEATNQTFVDALKNKGQFTEKAWAEAAQKALDACLASIRPATLEFMQRTYKDVNGYLATRIEAEVRRQKNAAPMSLGLPVAFTGQLETTGE